MLFVFRALFPVHWGYALFPIFDCADVDWNSPLPRLCSQRLARNEQNLLPRFPQILLSTWRGRFRWLAGRVQEVSGRGVERSRRLDRCRVRRQKPAEGDWLRARTLRRAIELRSHYQTRKWICNPDSSIRLPVRCGDRDNRLDRIVEDYPAGSFPPVQATDVWRAAAIRAPIHQ